MAALIVLCGCMSVICCAHGVSPKQEPKVKIALIAHSFGCLALCTLMLGVLK